MKLEFKEHIDYPYKHVLEQWGSWTESVEAAGMKTLHCGYISNDYVADIQEVAEELGRTPSMNEHAERQSYTKPAIYTKYDSYEDLIAEAGLESRQVIDEDVLQSLVDAYESSPRQYMTIDDYSELSEHSYRIVRLRFGSWRRGCNLAGVPPQPFKPKSHS